MREVKSKRGGKIGSSMAIASGTAIAVSAWAAGDRVALALPPDGARSPSTGDGVAAWEGRELVVLDPRVPNVDALRRSVHGRVATLVLDAERDGIAQITAALEGRGFGTVHVVAHGAPGRVHVGSTELTAARAHARGAELARWFGERRPYERPPELLIYGCDARRTA